MRDHMAGLPNPLMLSKLAYFLYERDHIRREREAGAPAPWTEDTILQTYRFCNVRRRDDRVSKWIIDNIITPYEYSDMLWFMICCARWINWPPTIKELIEKGVWPTVDFDPIRFGRVIDERTARGEKTWTGAYMITARQIPEGQGKGAFVAERMLNPLLTSDIGKYLNGQNAEFRTLETIMTKFQNRYGWGTFMSGQAVADMTYCRLLNKASDLYSYAPIGPGSTRGLNRLFGRKLEGKISQDQFNDELQFIAQSVHLLPLDGPRLTLHDWQNCMCEFDKYIRTENSSGRPRSTYKPETAF